MLLASVIRDEVLGSVGVVAANDLRAVTTAWYDLLMWFSGSGRQPVHEFFKGMIGFDIIKNSTSSTPTFFVFTS